MVIFQLRHDAVRGCFRFNGPVDSMDSVKLPSDNLFSLIHDGDIQYDGIQNGVLLLLLYCVQAPRCPRIATFDRYIGIIEW